MLISLLLSAALAGPWPDLADPPVVGGGDEVTAVVVAIDDYFAVPDVPGAEANGRAWYDWFVRGRGVPPERVTLLAGKEATAESIRAAATRAGQAGSGGQAWFVFVGHGGSVGGDAAVLGVDVQATLDSLAARGVRRQELGDALAAGGAAPVMVLDSCFSGVTPDGQPLVPGTQPVVPTYASAAPWTVLTAGTGDELAGALPGEPRPAFSYLLLGALQGWGDQNQDGQVVASEAVAFARGALTATLTGRTQRPALSGPDRPLGPAGTLPPPDLAAVVTTRTTEVPAGNAGAPVVSRRPASPAAPPTKKVCKATEQQTDPFSGQTLSVATEGAHVLRYGGDEATLTVYLGGMDAPKLSMDWRTVAPPGSVHLLYVLEDGTLVDLPSLAADAFEPRRAAWPMRFRVDDAVAEALASSRATHHRWVHAGADKITGEVSRNEAEALQRSFACQVQQGP